MVVKGIIGSPSRPIRSVNWRGAGVLLLGVSAASVFAYSTGGVSNWFEHGAEAMPGNYRAAGDVAPIADPNDHAGSKSIFVKRTDADGNIVLVMPCLAREGAPVRDGVYPAKEGEVRRVEFGNPSGLGSIGVRYDGDGAAKYGAPVLETGELAEGTEFEPLDKDGVAATAVQNDTYAAVVEARRVESQIGPQNKTVEFHVRCGALALATAQASAGGVGARD